MKKIFDYNWQIRDEWFDWCSKLPTGEIVKPRTGGMGSILVTLAHIADVEYSWIRAIQGEPDIEIHLEDYHTLETVQNLAMTYRSKVSEYLETWSSEEEDELVFISWRNGYYSKGEIIRHLIAHEIHHIGQLSVWAREIGVEPVSSNLIGRKLVKQRNM